MKRKSAWFLSPPWRLLLITFLTHGLLIPWLGFYWDDWTPVLVSLMPETTWREFVDAFAQNRPVSGLLFWALMGLLGPRPWAWHLFILVLRWLVAWQAALLVARIWPRPKELSWWTGLLLAIYPAFRVQPIAVAFTPHMLSFVGILASLLALWAGWQQQSGWRRGLWWTASWLGMLASFLLLEYYIGLEVARWALLGYLAWQTRQTTRRWPWKTLLAYGLPYGIALAIGFTLIRSWSRPPELDFGLRMLLKFPGLVPYSMFYVLFGGWFPAAFFDVLTWKSRKAFALLTLAGMFGLTLAIFVLRLLPSWKERSLAERGLPNIIGIGFVLSLAGFLPFWVNGRLVGSLYSDRFTLPALLGAALIWAVVLTELRRTPWLQRALMIALVTLAGLTLLKNGLTFVLAWHQVRTIYAQVLWRVPYLERGTVILGEGAQALYIAEYVVGESLNALYIETQSSPRELAYWYYPLGLVPPPSTDKSEAEMYTEHKIWRFRGNARSSLIFLSRLAREGKRCVWVLMPEDESNPYLPDDVRRYAAYAAPERIRRSPQVEPPSFFGIPPQDTSWCYFFEKAELARQFEDWETVIELWQQAQRLERTPKHIYEYRPFILAYGYLGRWEEALDLSLRAWQERPQGGDDEAIVYLCQTWQRLLEGTPATTERAEAWNKVRSTMNWDCHRAP